MLLATSILISEQYLGKGGGGVVPAAVSQSHCSSTVYENQANKWRETAVDGVDVAYMMY